MVADSSKAQHIDDLTGDSICFMIGSPEERGLDAPFEGIHQPWLRRAFSESGEMADAYVVQNCHAIAGEITALASIRLEPGAKNMKSRILPEVLSAFPAMATTGTSDAQWSSIVAWAVYTLVSAERPGNGWFAGGAGAMPVSAPEPRLDPERQHRVLAATGRHLRAQPGEGLAAGPRPQSQCESELRGSSSESGARVSVQSRREEPRILLERPQDAEGAHRGRRCASKERRS
jgi:general L-amino acid transport system substrate-binding protein